MPSLQSILPARARVASAAERDGLFIGRPPVVNVQPVPIQDNYGFPIPHRGDLSVAVLVGKTKLELSPTRQPQLLCFPSYETISSGPKEAVLATKSAHHVVLAEETTRNRDSAA